MTCSTSNSLSRTGASASAWGCRRCTTSRRGRCISSCRGGCTTHRPGLPGKKRPEGERAATASLTGPGLCLCASVDLDTQPADQLPAYGSVGLGSHLAANLTVRKKSRNSNILGYALQCNISGSSISIDKPSQRSQAVFGVAFMFVICESEGSGRCVNFCVRFD